MLPKMVRLVLVLGLLAFGDLVVGGTVLAAEEPLQLSTQLFSLTAAVPPDSVDTGFGLIPRDSYGAWRRAFASGVDDTSDVAEALFQYRAVRVKADVLLCPWGYYWTSAGQRCVEIAPTTAVQVAP